MSDPTQDSPESTPSPQQESGGGRHKVFFGIIALLGVLVAGFCYEMYVARPAAQAAFDKVANARLKSIRDEITLTNLDIRDLLGRDPSETFSEGDDQFEVYHWGIGVIVDSHKLYTVYQKDGEDWVFVRHSKFSDDSTENALVVVNAPEEDEEDTMYGGDEDGGGPPQGSGGDRGAGDNGAVESEQADRPEMEDDEEGGESKPESTDD